MKHIKAFASRIKDTFYNPSFYQQSITEPRGKSMLLLFWVNVLAANVFAISVLVAMIPALIDFSKSNFVADEYPDGLIVEIKDDVVTVNQEVPYFLPAAEELGIDNENLIVIDTSDDVSMDMIQSYDSLAVLTKDSIYFAKNKNEMRIFSLNDTDDITITEQKVVSWGHAAEKWFYIAILPLVLFMIGLMAGISFVYYLFISLALALVPLLIGKMRKLNITYKSAYIISLYALVPMVMIDTVTTLMGMPFLPFLVVLVIFTVVVVANLPAGKLSEEVPLVD